MMAFVEPPIASSTRSAFSTERAVMIWLGRSRVAPSVTACRPLASAARRRSACTAGIAAVPGSAMPSASAIAAIVLAVPITAQVPAVVARFCSIWQISSAVTPPARYLAQKRRQSVQAPTARPGTAIGIIGPPGAAPRARRRTPRP